MKYIKGDLFESGEWEVFAQICNNYKTFGAGFAKIVKEKYPKVYQADLNTVDGSSKLGTFSYGNTEDYRNGFNLYAMYGIGNNGNPLNRNLSYDHLYNALYKMCQKLSGLDWTLQIGVPYMIGCGLAGGEILIVEAILKDIESKFNVEFLIYQLD